MQKRINGYRRDDTCDKDRSNYHIASCSTDDHYCVDSGMVYGMWWWCPDRVPSIDRTYIVVGNEDYDVETVHSEINIMYKVQKSTTLTKYKIR